MSARRALLIAVWILSLAVAGQFSARAQQPTPASSSEPGYELRFVQTGAKDGMPVGMAAARINGKWVAVQLQAQATKPELRPAAK